MTLEWAQSKEQEALKEILEEQKKIIEYVSSLSFLSDKEKELINNRTKEILDNPGPAGYFMPYITLISSMIKEQREETGIFRDDLYILNNILDNSDETKDIRLKIIDEERISKEFEEKGIFTNKYLRLLRWNNPKHFYRYVDIGPYEFDGDIVITDPCYVLTSEELHCAERDDLIKAGFREAMVNSTLYGDWSCTTFDINSKEILGEFCADGGEVCVLYLDDLEKIQPAGYNWLVNFGGIERGCATLIKNFKGTITFVISEEHFKFEGEDCIDYELKVVGKGINSATGEPLEFIGTQTGL